LLQISQPVTAWIHGRKSAFVRLWGRDPAGLTAAAAALAVLIFIRYFFFIYQIFTHAY
jgi:hypothetical protein